MKRYLPHISTIIILITIVVVGFGHVAHAGGPFFGYGIHDLVTGFLAELVNGFLSIAAWILTLSGAILNMSMTLTLNMKEFVEGTPAVYTVWKAIRDISGMFLIFTLLFAAIKMILAPVGVPGPSVGSLIKTVVIAGILINFSFFVASLGIDVSNIVSVQLYNTIAPANSLNYEQLKGGANTSIRSKFDGGISDIFMKSLKISNIYDARTASLNASGSDENPGTFSASLQIILGGVFGIGVMLTAAVSFFLAALAFIVRFVALIMLLGFSPIWFAAYAVPDLKQYADKWAKTYKAQLIFMPVYLLLMYFALSILTSSNLFQEGFATNRISAGGEWWGNFMVLGINAAIVIVMLNAPLLAAISVGAIMPKWAGSAGAGALWKKFGGFAGGTTGGWAGRRFISQPLASLDKKIGNTKIGNSILARDIRSATIGQAEKWKYGGSRTNSEYVKVEKEVASKNREIDRKATVLQAVADGGQGLPPIIDPNTGKPVLDTVFKAMNEKEKLSLSVDDVLTKPEIIVRMKDKDFEAIKKSEDISDEDKAKVARAREDALKVSAQAGDADTVKKLLSNMNDEQRKSLASTRNEALRNAISSGNSDTIKHLVEDMDGKELLQISKDNANVVDDGRVIKHLSSSQLKKMAEDGLDPAVKRSIGTQIEMWRAAGIPHKAAPFIAKNASEWL